MKLLRSLAAILLVGLSALPFAIGLFVAFNSEWVPQREISSFEAERVQLARLFVEERSRRGGALPTYVEFGAWKENAPQALSVEGQGFDYWPDGRRYSFSWWDGDTSVSWYSDRPSSLVLISPEHVFFFGSKLFDIVAFFGSGAVLLCAAWLVARSTRGRWFRAS